MKIDVITFHNVNNYGSVLQTYATQEKLREFGRVEIIDYCRFDQIDYHTQMQRALENKKWNKIPFLRGVYKLIKAPSYIKQSSVFGGFINKYIGLSEKRYINYRELKNDPPKADVYCVGSDQMWNSDYNEGIELAFYLAFVPANKMKMSFATSIGMMEFNDAEGTEVSKLLQEFQHISVREDCAVSALKKIGMRNVQLVLDPTLMLTRDEWRKLSTESFLSGKYVLMYQLNPNKEMDRFAQRLAKEKNMKLIRIGLMYDHVAKVGRTVVLPEVTQFVSLIDKAEYVVTDSFHGTAFCINFNKEFYVFNPPRFSSRINSILSLTNLTGRVINTCPEVLDTKRRIDYSSVNQIINHERSVSNKFLSKAFMGNKE